MRPKNALEEFRKESSSRWKALFLLAQRLFGRPLAALTGLDVSVLIDTLKDIKSDLIDLAAILEDDAP